jgi:hypothetical protein
LGYKSGTYLSIYLTVEPPLAAPEPPRERLECDHETDLIIKSCERWARDLTAKHPGRKVRLIQCLKRLYCRFVQKYKLLSFQVNPLVADVNGHAVLITRYFRAIKPPQELMSRNVASEVDEEAGSGLAFNSVAAAEKVAWFVSLIPHVSKAAMFPGLQVRIKNVLGAKRTFVILFYFPFEGNLANQRRLRQPLVGLRSRTRGALGQLLLRHGQESLRSIRTGILCHM